MITAALIDANNIVVNVIVVDDESYDPGPGLTLIPVTEATGPAAIGGTWNGQIFTPPPPLPPDPDAVSLYDLDMINRKAQLGRQVDRAGAEGDLSGAITAMRKLQELG